MLGMSGIRMLYKGAEKVLTAPQNLVDVPVPTKTHVHSMTLHDVMGRPIYRKDTAV